MKKYISYFALAILLLSFIACDLQPPTGIRIVGNPSFSAGYTYEIANLLADMIKGGLPEDDDSLTVIECTNQSLTSMTFIIHFNALNMEFEMADEGLDEMLLFVDDMVADTIDKDALFPVNETDLDADEMAIALDDILAELNESDDAEHELPVTFTWNGVDVNIDRQTIISSLSTPESKAAIIADIESGNPASDAIENAIAAAVKEAVKAEIARTTITLSDDIELIPEDIEPFALPLADFSQYLKGFSINGMQARIFLSVADKDDNSNPNFLEFVHIGLNFDDDTVDNIEKEGIDDLSASGIVTSTPTFAGAALPNQNKGIDFTSQIDSILSLGEDVNVDFTAVLMSQKDGAEVQIPMDFIGKHYVIKAEIVIWLPLSLKAGSDGANFEIPFGDGDGDLFSRSSADPIEFTDFIKSMTVSVRLNSPAFSNMDIVFINKNLSSAEGGFSKAFPVSGQNLRLVMTEEDLRKLNSAENFPFVPEISIKINPSGTLNIPRALSIVRVELNAELDYYIEL